MTGMSSSLKERLKKCGRYHPATPPINKPSTPQSNQLKNPPSLPSTPLSSRCLSRPSTGCTSKTSRGSTKHFRKYLPPPRNILNVRSILDRQVSVPHGGLFCNEHVDPILDTCSLRDPDCDPPQAKTVKIEFEGPKRTDTENITFIESNSNIMFANSISNTNITEQPQTVYEGVVSFHDELHVSNVSSHKDGSSVSLNSYDVILKSKQHLEVQVAQHRESLRKLNMVKTYRIKNDLHHLETLINKWRSVCQQAILDLHQLTAEPRPSLTLLVQQLGVDAQILRFNSDDECFDTS